MEIRRPIAIAQHRGAARREAGFTLIEVMMVVAIISFLSAVAIPAFMQYMKKARSAEATEVLRRMYEGARAYIMEDQQGRGSSANSEIQYPNSEAVSPAANCCAFPAYKCVPDPIFWTSATWVALKFGMEEPHYYRYQFDSQGTGNDSIFTARALGDLDCDGVVSTFEMVGGMVGGAPSGSAGHFESNPLE